ncbi:MAG: TIGR04255 family protein [Oscillibacter sp.]|nr:TIGR04255 family protein [Oscillibacter sp.]
MLLSDRARTHYAHAPVHEVICQLRFPTILSINQTEPAEFQEAIRDAFPQYARRQDQPAPKVTGLGGPNVQVERQQPVTNYHFLSADGGWKLNMTRDFIALSTLRYPGWEEFARHLDRPLAAFIQLYKPAYFQRVGLRYVNLISRDRLSLTDRPWSALIAPAYLGPLGAEDLREDQVLTCGADMTLQLDSSCRAKIHAGPGHIKMGSPSAAQDPETKFILDLDLSMGDRVECTLAAAALETLHGHADRVFEGAVTDALRAAMR